MAVDQNGNEIVQPSPEAPKENRAQERINELSDKVKTEAEARQTAETARADAERRATFAEGFVDVVSAHPAAKDHKDEIKAKVIAGYTVQDATFAVLGAAGKLGGTQPPIIPQVAGGSASTTVPSNPDKKPSEMTQAERREVLSKEMVWQ